MPLADELVDQCRVHVFPERQPHFPAFRGHYHEIPDLHGDTMQRPGVLHHKDGFHEWASRWVGRVTSPPRIGDRYGWVHVTY